MPRSDYQIVDTWNTFGLKATGSHDVKIERAFVPEHRTHKAMDGYLCRNPGQEANPGDIFKLPWAAVFTRAVSTASIGATEACWPSFLEIAKSRVSTNTGMATKADPFALSAAANAAAEVASMKATLFKAFDDMMAVVRAGKDVAAEDRCSTNTRLPVSPAAAPTSAYELPTAVGRQRHLQRQCHRPAPGWI